MNGGLVVACLCADWCGTCREYRPGFEALAQEFPQYRFVWIDVEEQADIDVEIENFPTILVAHGVRPLFAGTMLPHIGHLRRLLQALDEDSDAQLGALPANELAAYQKLAAQIETRGT